MQADPVCGVRVRERGNRQRVEYAGQAYFFCSSECLERFDAQPDLFTAGPAEAGWPTATAASCRDMERAFRGRDRTPS